MKQTRRQRAAPAHWQTELERGTASQSYPPGISLLRQGAPVHEVYVLQSGLVKLLHTAANGRECMLGLRTAGDWLGCAAASLDEAAPFSAATLTACELYRLPLAAYLDWLQTDIEFAWQQHIAQSRELLGQWQQTVDLICVSARQRLEQTLWQLAQTQADGQRQRSVRLQLPLQQQELASLIAVTPSHLSRLFSTLEEVKLLRREQGWLVLTAPDKLWRALPLRPPADTHDSKTARRFP